MFWAVELVADARTSTPLADAQVAAVKKACQERGVLVFPSANRIHMVPPCLVSPQEVERAVAALDEALGTL